MWSLREDPAYFADTLRGASRHDQETVLLDELEQHLPATTFPFWDRVITHIVDSVYQNLITWDIIWRELQGLEDLRQRYKHSMLPGKRLPKQYKQALSHFSNLLEVITESVRKTIPLALAGCRSFRGYLSRKSLDTKSTECLHVAARSNPKDRLWWLLVHFLDEHATEICGLPSLLNELERLILSDKKEKSEFPRGWPEKYQILQYWVKYNVSWPCLLQEGALQAQSHLPSLAIR